MGKVKVHRTQPSLDMTPMVDLAFLLVTFFMLTASMTQDEVAVDTPSSVSEIILPDRDVLTVTISKDGKAFFNMDGKYHRQELLTKMGERYGIDFTPKELERFAVLPSFGLPVGNLKEYLDMSPEDRKLVSQPGIPADSTHNELADWIVFARITNPKLRFAIKGDGSANYPAVKDVVNTFIDKKVLRFNLITNLEKGQ